MGFTEYASELINAGFKVIPLSWDVNTLTGKPMVEHGSIDAATDCSVFFNQPCTGIALKLFAPFVMIDFDLKNTEDKGLFNDWLQMVNAELPEVMRKLCIESTRNGGYHVYMMASGISRKTMLARSASGAEVIAYYTNSVLSFCSPTPGYSIVHGDMAELEQLTANELEAITAICAHFDQYKEATPQAKIIITYPEQYLQTCKDFDDLITDDAWEQMLNSLGLYEVKDYRYKRTDKHLAYLRKGSTAKFSAKVYWKSRKLLLFTTSIPGYPTHEDYTRDRPGEWILTPTKILYYTNCGDWQQTIEQIQMMADSMGIEVAQPQQRAATDYPLHAFPKYLQDSIREVSHHRSIPEHFVATSCLWGASALAGNAYVNELLPNSENILFVILVAPVSVGKTPSIKATVFDPLKKAMWHDDQEYKQLLKGWEDRRMNAANKKKAFTEPRPRRYLPLVMDGTTEAFVSIHTDQPNGIGVFYDEAETIFNAGNYKAINDSVTFYTTAFNGGPLNITRADREKERVIPDVNINLMAGTQPDRLSNIFSADKIAAGFPARFLMVYSDYKQLNTESDPFSAGIRMCREWQDTITALYNFGKKHNQDAATRYIKMEQEAIELYRGYFKQGLQEANARIESKEHPVLIGLGAKMSAYLMRVTQVLAIIHNYDAPVITADIMRHGYDLYNYCYQSTADLLMRSYSEAETGLPMDLDRLHRKLPDERFTRAQAREICVELGLREGKFDDAMKTKKFKELFRRVAQGVYEKL